MTLLTTGPLSYHRVGDINLLVENESWNSDVEIPKYPVERGVDVTDHVQKKSRVLNLSGVLLTDRKLSARVKINKLETYKNRGNVLPYYGRRNATNLLIHKFTYVADKSIANGYRFTMILEEVRFAERVVKPAPVSARKKAQGSLKNTQNQRTGTPGTAVYHITKKGDTYAKIAKQYGVTWQQVKKFAGYPDTRIPVGVKVRVK